MEKKKSDFAFVVGSSNAYSFGLISTMNAQDYFKTNADWEIVVDDSWDQEHLKKLSSAFPFNVNIYGQKELLEDFFKSIQDKRSDKTYPVDPWQALSWLAWLLLTEKKYKAVCVLQADQFVFVNLDSLFRVAASGVMVTGEFPFSVINVEEMPFGDHKGIWNRCQCGAFDSINFYGQEHRFVLFDKMQYCLEDSFKDEASHPVIAHNRAICNNIPKDRVLGLPKGLWVADNIWSVTDLYWHKESNKIFNSAGLRINGWHCRWWENDRIQHELNLHRNIDIFGRLKNNYNLVKDFMEYFNNIKPNIRSNMYQKGTIS